MTQAAIAADFAQALDVQSGLTAQVAFDGVGLDGVTQLLLVCVGQILYTGVGVDTSLRQDVLSALSANTVDISESDLDSLILRQVNTGNTCHNLKHLHFHLSPVSACAWGSRK